MDSEAFRAKLRGWRAAQGEEVLAAYWRAIPGQVQASMDFEGDAVALDLLEAQQVEL